MEFTGKVVLITGASSGIGAAAAVKFAALDADLAIVGRNQANLEKTAANCENQRNRKPLIINADVTKDADKIIQETIDRFRRLDVLINNAGIYTIQSFTAGIADFDTMMATNLRAPYLLSYLAMPHLVKTKGNIINVSSILSFWPNSGSADYCIAKAGLDMMTKCFAVKYGKEGVRVNAVNPGPVKTNVFKRAGIENDTAMFAMIQQMVPLKIVASGEDIAELMAFLASDKAHFITGSLYVIDGGVSLKDDINLESS